MKTLLTCCRCEINYSKVAQQEKSPVPIHLDPSVKFFSLRMVYVCVKYCRVFSAHVGFIIECWDAFSRSLIRCSAVTDDIPTISSSIVAGVERNIMDKPRGLIQWRHTVIIMAVCEYTEKNAWFYKFNSWIVS